MHDRKTGSAGAASTSAPPARIPADYSEWVSQKVFEVGLPNCETEAQAIFPFALRLGHPTNRAKRVQNGRLASAFPHFRDARLLIESWKGF